MVRDLLTLAFTFATIIAAVVGIQVLTDIHETLTRPAPRAEAALPSEAEVRRLEQKADAIDKALRKLGPRIEGSAR